MTLGFVNPTASRVSSVAMAPTDSVDAAAALVGIFHGQIFQGGKNPRSLTWNLKISPWKRRFLLETIIFRFHVRFQGCSLSKVAFPKGKDRLPTIHFSRGEMLNFRWVKVFPPPQENVVFVFRLKLNCNKTTGWRWGWCSCCSQNSVWWFQRFFGLLFCPEIWGDDPMLTNSMFQVFQVSGKENTKLVSPCFLFDVRFGDVFSDFLDFCWSMSGPYQQPFRGLGSVSPSCFSLNSSEISVRQPPENEHIPMVGVHEIAGNKRMVTCF